MLPFPLLLWDTDVTARIALEESLQSSFTTLGTGGLTSGGNVAVDARFYHPDALYLVRARADYQRFFGFAAGGGAGPPADNLSSAVGASAGYRLSPLTTLSLGLDGYLATTWGVRAADALAVRDPFLFGQRLQYTAGASFDLTTTLSTRATLSLAGGYLQAGALSADSPEAVGVDTHAPRASLAYGYELGPRDRLDPELHYQYTHYYHALYDMSYRRGPADVHAATALLGEEHDFSKQITAAAGGGVTVATPMPILRSRSVIVAPEARLSITFAARRHHLTAAYAFTYTSLGPRIGYGQEHTGSLGITARPLDGASFRDFVVRGVARVAHGAAPVGATPELAAGPAALPPNGTITTTTIAAGAALEYPILRGLALTAGFDLAFVRGRFDPVPRGGSPAPVLNAVTTVGIAYTLSTDPARTVPRGPGEDEKERPVPGKGERAEDRTRENVGRPDAAPDDRDEDPRPPRTDTPR